MNKSLNYINIYVLISFIHSFIIPIGLYYVRDILIIVVFVVTKNTTEITNIQSEPDII